MKQTTVMAERAKFAYHENPRLAAAILNEHRAACLRQLSFWLK